MHSSILLAALAATAAMATPLRERQAPTWAAASYAPAPTGVAPPKQSSVPEPPKVEPPQGGDKPVATGVLGNPNAKPNPTVPAELSEALNDAPTNVLRFTELKKALDAGTANLKFDHNPAANPQVTPGAGGQVDLANAGNFALLNGEDIANAVIFFQPCGLNTPHSHPRATEYFTLATDSNMTTGFVMENGFTTELTTELSIWQGTAFPMGSIHWQQNNDCEPAVGTAGLNSQDPGASSIAQNYLRFTREDVVLASIGASEMPAEINGQNFAQFKEAIPAPLAQGVESCLKRCNIKY